MSHECSDLKMHVWPENSIVLMLTIIPTWSNCHMNTEKSFFSYVKYGYIHFL